MLCRTMAQEMMAQLHENDIIIFFILSPSSPLASSRFHALLARAISFLRLSVQAKLVNFSSPKPLNSISPSCSGGKVKSY